MSYLEMLIQRNVPDTPEALLQAASEYVSWVQENPLLENMASVSKGFVVRYDLEKTRAMSYRAFAGYIGTSERELNRLRLQPEFQIAFEMIDQVFYVQKFEHAAAGMLNPALIARDLGLADKQELTGRDGGPLQVEQTHQEVSKFLTKLQGMMEKPPE